MSETTDQEAQDSERQAAFFGGFQNCLELTRKTLEAQADRWQRMGNELRSGEYDMDSAVKDLQDSAEAALGYYAELLDVGVRSMSSVLGGLGSDDESR